MGKKRAASENNEQGSKRPRVSEVENRNEETTLNGGEDVAVELNNSQNPGFSLVQMDQAECGIIEKITLQNFMCHSNLSVKLGPNVNFVIGRNGSGKSAIMTGIIVGLGGKAFITNRGSSLRNFVKDKCNTAIIQVQLKNQGSDAYKPDLYGDSIFVERRISHDGTGSYKIISSNGGVISTKKEELNHILDQFNIQIDNPVSILNQDTSRNFLCASNPEGKYKFFLKATQLEEISNNYLLIQGRHQSIKAILEKKKEAIPIMEIEVDKLEERYRDVQQLKVLEQNIENLKKEIAWAQVIEKEKKLQPIKNSIICERERAPKYDAKLEECKINLNKKEELWSEIQAKLDGISRQSDQLKDDQEELNSRVSKVKTILRSYENDLKRIKSDIRNSEKEKNELEIRIEDITANARQDIESERLERERSLKEKREELQQIQFQLNTTSHHKTQLENNVANANEKIYQMRSDVSDGTKNIDQLKRKLNSLRDGQKDHLKRFGSWVPELLRKIETATRRGRFHQAPKGPIGASLKLRDESWAVPIEICLKGIAFGFCCTDSHDGSVLQELMEGFVPPERFPPVIVSEFQEQFYDVSSNKPQSKYPTVVDVLEVNDPVIYNCVVDQTGGESILLIKNPEEARDVMFNHPPPKATKAFAGNGDQIFGGESAKSYAYTGSGASYLKGNIEDEIRKVQGRCEEETQKLSDLKHELGKQEFELQNLNGQLRQSKTKNLKEQEICNRKIQEISELEQFEEEVVPDVTVLQEDVTYLTQQIQEFLSTAEEKQEKFTEAKVTLHKTTDESEAHKTKIQDVIAEAELLATKLNKIEVDISKEKSHKKYYLDRKKELVDKITKMENELKQLQKEAEEAKALATEYCEVRIETKRSVKNLESEILQTERRLRAEQQTKGQVAEITKQFAEAKERLDQVKCKMSSLKMFSKRLGGLLQKRLENFSQYRRYIALRAKQNFQMMLSQRGYTGKMKFIHDKEQLFLDVNVEQGEKSGSCNSKSLSGGERSFSTISFIMSLWDAMEAPFRCLDEFDVFMDMVNRRISMQMMMKIATEQRHRQFILLTPQDMSDIGGGRYVKIFRLQDPDRGQTTLPFQPVESQ